MSKRRFILGTAGHVDHGKTELVRCLTGWETDRLKEERERGISIELGFAPLRLDEETMIGIVDVPGHERFVRQMVAGAGGIDLAILVVAADEGVMPQTQEHLEVMRSLQVAHGIVVVSKSDLAPEDLRRLVIDDIEQLVAGTFLEGAPLVFTSAQTGQGIEDLLAALRDVTKHITDRPIDGPFRLAVDRVFHRQGIGVVVTGSGYSGTVRTGDDLELLPGCRRVRVREIQSFLDKRNEGFAGERLAIALQGARLTEVNRGDMLVTPGAFSASSMIDARVLVADYGTFELKQRERIRIHHGAREVLGRLVLLDRDKLTTGMSGLVQIRLETPLVAAEKDHFVVRKYSPARVVGGGTIIDPHAKKHRRGDGEVLEYLRIQEEGDRITKLRVRIAGAGLGGAPARDIQPVDFDELIRSGQIVQVDDRLYDAAVLDSLGKAIREAVDAYVERHILRRGMDKEELRQKTGFPGPTQAFNRVLEIVAAAHAITVHERKVTPRELPPLPDALARGLEELSGAFAAAGLAFPRPEELTAVWPDQRSLNDGLQYLREEGRLSRIGRDQYVDAASLTRCVDRVREWFTANPELTVGDFKTLFDVTRKHAIPLLEYFDEKRITVRQGNVRRQGPNL